VNEANSIYNYERTLDRELSHIKKDPFNSEILLKYYQSRVAEGLSLARIIKCLSTLRLISQSLRKPFSKATKDDIVDLIAKIEQRKISEWTKRDYKIVLKRFYKWFRDSENYPSEVRWIRATNNVPNKLQKKDLLTWEEVQKIVDCATSIRDKAFIWVYFESMRRLGEILSLKIGNIEFDDLGARLVVNGKIGRDNARVIASAPLLASWLNIHPLRDNPDAPVWVTLNRKEKYKQIAYSAVRSMLKDCAQRAGIKKRVWLYLIRHSRITPASKVLSYALLCSTAGWKQGSKMPSVYIHLAGEDVDEAQCMLNGVANVEKREEMPRPKVCKRCNTKNSPDSKFCNKCGFPLDYETAIKIDEAREKVDSLMNELIRNPKVLNALLEGIGKLKDEQINLSFNDKTISNGERAKKVQERKDGGSA
jgi:integrase/ribosomal protein L40E